MHRESMDGQDGVERPEVGYETSGDDTYYTGIDAVTADMAPGASPDIDDNFGAEETATYWQTEANDLTGSDTPGDVSSDTAQSEHTPFEAIRDECAAAFTDYKEEAATFAAQVEEYGEDYMDIPGYVDSGTNVDVFDSPTHPGVLVKIVNPAELVDPVEHVRERVAGLIAGREIENLERLKAFSDDPELLAVVTTRMEGQLLRDYTEEQRDAIPVEDFEQLLRTYSEMQDVNLNVEWGTKNITHQPGKGFSLFDFELDKRGQTLQDKVLQFADVDMLLENSFNPTLPRYAHTFRAACAKVLGEDMARAIDELWERRRSEYFR